MDQPPKSRAAPPVASGVAQARIGTSSPPASIGHSVEISEIYYHTHFYMKSILAIAKISHEKIWLAENWSLFTLCWGVGISPKTLLNMPFLPSLYSTTVVLPNGFEASLYDEFLSSGSKRYQYIPQQVSQPQPFLPQHLQQQQQQHRRGYGGLVIKREEDPYSRFVQYLTVCKKFHFT